MMAPTRLTHRPRGGNRLKLIRFLLWTLLALALTLVADQLMLKRNFTTVGLTQMQVFYRDFRARLLTLGNRDAYHDRIGQTIEAQLPSVTTETSSRYLYVDRDGILHFADRFDDVPPAYRQGAQRLGD